MVSPHKTINAQGCSLLIRAILREKSMYGEDSADFRPERFMKGKELDESIPIPEAAFGFGRRICAGKASAETSVWITIASLLAVFDIRGEEGLTEKDYGEFSTGVVS
jgi:cytochrome P450